MPRASKPKGPENAGLLKSKPSSTHEALAAYITDTTGEAVGAEVVALVQRAYPLYLKSPAVEAAKAAEREAKEREKAERERKRAEQVKARLDKLEQERAKLLEQLQGAQFVPTEEVEDDEPEDEPEVIVDEAAEPEVVVEEADDEFVVPDGDPVDDDEEDPDDEFESDEEDEDDDF